MSFRSDQIRIEENVCSTLKQLNVPIMNADLFATFDNTESVVGRILYSWSQDDCDKKYPMMIEIEISMSFVRQVH